MPRTLSPAELANRIRKWAAVGVDVSIVDGVVTGLEVDEKESEARAPRRQGKLAKTIRVIRPSATQAAKKGVIRAALAAGSRSADRRKGVPYASVLQTGKVGYPPASRTKPHEIKARRADYSGGRIRTTGVLSFLVGGRRVYARAVKHPGSRFKQIEYLQVNETRLAGVIDRSTQKRIDAEIG
jgi:hypothetical protein